MESRTENKSEAVLGKIRKSLTAFFRRDKKRGMSQDVIDAIVKACIKMSEEKVGALIVIEQKVSLDELLTKRGVKIDSAVTEEFLCRIFDKNTPLHDGAVIIKGDRIESAMCFLPMSDGEKISNGLGTRHHAAAGITEKSDAFVIVVSEETGCISCASGGVITRNKAEEQLADELKALEGSKEENVNGEFKLLNNACFKILALLLAFVVWWSIVNIDDPLVKKNIAGISVELQNTGLLTDKGYIYQVTSGATTSITVRAPQSVISELKASDFKAVADFSQLNTVTDSVPIVISCTKEDVVSNIVEMNSKTTMVKLSIDNKQSSTFTVDMDVIGSPADDYYVGEYHLSPATIKITGAEAAVEAIDRVAVTYDITGMTGSVSEKLVPVFYDADGNELDVSSLDLSRTSFGFYLEILPSKWIDIKYAVTGTPVEDYVMTGYDDNIRQVKITGTKENLAAISSIDIPANVIDITGISENTLYEVKLANYLSDNYRIVSDTKILDVNVYIEKQYTKMFTIPTSEIIVHNLADKLAFRYEQDTIEVEINAINEVLDNFDLAVLNASIDMHNCDVGEHELVVAMTSDANFEIVGTYTVKLVAYDKEEETEPEGETTEELTTGGLITEELTVGGSNEQETSADSVKNVNGTTDKNKETQNSVTEAATKSVETTTKGGR